MRRTGTYGFTLIEVMVSLAVLGMIGVSLWAATSQTSKARDIVENAHSRLHQVRVTFDMLSRDIGSAFLSLHRGPLEPSHDTIFLGTDHGEEDRLDFASFSHTRRYLDANESDQAEISYFLADDPEISGQVNLVRRSSAMLDKEATEGGNQLILIHNVEEFDLQYFDKSMNEWQDEWDTTNLTGNGSKLPTQIRVRLVVNIRKGGSKMNRSYERYEKVSYGTQIMVPLSTPIWIPSFVPGPPIPVN